MSALEQISRVKHIFKEDLRIIFINALVFLSRLYYCSLVWFNITDTHIRKLQSFQIFSARIVSDTSYKIYDYVSQMLKRLRWLSVKTNLYFRDAVLVFKCMTGMAQDHLSNKFISRGNISGRANRTSHN